MIKTKSLQFALFVALLVSTLPTFAVDFTVGNLTYSILSEEDATVSVTAASIQSEVIVSIPASISYNERNYTVTEIGANAFESAPITELFIPENVIYIHERAFADCNALTKITLEGSPTPISICANSFVNCTEKELYYGRDVNSVKVTGVYYTFAFYGQKQLENLVFGSFVTDLSNHYFSNASNLSSIEFEYGESPLQVGVLSYSRNMKSLYINRNLKKSIGLTQSFLYNTDNLTTINFGDKITEIGPGLFYGFNGLTEITIPNNISTVWNAAFMNCSNLQKVTIDAPITELKVETFEGCSALSSITLPNTLQSITGYAFINCSSLQEIVFPASLSYIGTNTFKGCTSLRNVRFENADTPITLAYNDYGQNTSLFRDCPLETLYIGRNISYTVSEQYNYSPFAKQSNLSTVECGGSFNCCSDYLFYEATSLSSFFSYNSILSYGDYCFYKCSSFPNLEIADGVEAIGKYAFYGCTAIQSLSIPASINLIDDYAFYSTGIKNLIFSDSDTQLSYGWYAFSCPLEKTYIGRNLKSRVAQYQSRIYYGNTKLTDVEFNPNVTLIEDYMFCKCSALTNITLPTKLTTLYGRAFAYCTNLQSISIPPLVNKLWGSVFSKCTSLSSVIFEDSENPIEVLPTSINDNDYFGAFHDCPLNYVYIGRNLQYETYSWRGYSPFYGISSLESVETSNNFTSVGDYLFWQCTNLKSVNLSGEISNIGTKSFDGCNLLQTLKLCSLIPPSCDSQFSSVQYSNTELFVPSESISLYKSDNIWKNFYNIFPLGDIPVESIVLSKNEITLFIGEQFHLEWALIPEYASSKDVSVISLNPDIATVSEGGLVSALSTGTTNIVVSWALNPEVKAMCTVIVEPVIATSISITPSSVDDEVGSIIQLLAVILPENTTNKSVTWESTDTSVALVSDEGVLELLCEGSCYVIAHTMDGSNLYSLCKVNSETTGIETIVTDLKNSTFNVFSFDGKQIILNGNIDDLRTLPSGLYIINGKKVMLN